jgi:hypothetical protein
MLDAYNILEKRPSGKRMVTKMRLKIYHVVDWKHVVEDEVFWWNRLKILVHCNKKCWISGLKYRLPAFQRSEVRVYSCSYFLADLRLFDLILQALFCVLSSQCKACGKHTTVEGLSLSTTRFAVDNDAYNAPSLRMKKKIETFWKTKQNKRLYLTYVWLISV